MKCKAFIHFQKKKVNGRLHKLICPFFSSWYCIESDAICTRGKVLKINSSYAFQENGFVDIVQVTNVHLERGYLYCSLFFTSKNKIITVRHTMKKGTYVFWRLLDIEEYGELLSTRLWYEVTKDE